MEFRPISPARHPPGTLPRNLLPVALSCLRGDDTRTRALIPAEGTDTAVISAADIAAARPFPGGEDHLIGPPARAPGSLHADAPPGPPGPPRLPRVAIIDIGTAFWLPAFRRTDGTPAFTAVAMIEAEPDAAPRVSVLGRPAIAGLCDLFDRHGNGAVVARLAQAYPGSIYGDGGGTRPALGPRGMAHGTAMASLILRDRPLPGLVAVELPAQAYLDRSGDVLRGLAVPAVAQAMALAGPGPAPLHVALSFAYLGGPSPADGDAGDPLHAALEATLAARQGDTWLYLPTGNQLQSRQHLRCGDIAPGAGTGPLTWDIPGADPTPNTVELHWTGAGPVRLTLTDPAGQAAHATLSPGDVVAAGTPAPIAAAHLMERGGWHSLRITLAPTRGPNAAPAGQWTVALHTDHALGDLHGMVLRDDPPGLAELVRASRQSRFFDPAYPHRAPNGLPITDDPSAPQSVIRRRGTASHLVLGQRTRRVAVTALELGRRTPGDVPAPYAGRLPNGQDAGGLLPVAVGTTLRPGIVTRTSGGGAHARLAGTSVAAAEAIRMALR